MPTDVLHRFQLENAGVRGAIVRLDDAWRQIRTNGDHAGPLAEILGQAVAASALFTSTIKFEGRLSIHLRDSGSLKLLFAECTHDGVLRGVARWQGAPPTALIVPDPGARLAITIENTIIASRYQGLVPVEGDTLAEAFEGYFQRSEQLPTRLALAADDERCGGLMLQDIAAAGGDAMGDEDGWNRAAHLLATLTPQELLILAPEETLLRLFHDERVRMHPAQALRFGCTCSRERVNDMLRALGPAENESVLAEQGSIDVSCEFCNRRYVLDAEDVAEIFNDGARGGQTTRH